MGYDLMKTAKIGMLLFVTGYLDNINVLPYHLTDELVSVSANANCTHKAKIHLEQQSSSAQYSGQMLRGKAVRQSFLLLFLIFYYAGKQK